MTKILPDLLALIGLAILGYGLFLFSLRLSCVVVGVILIIYGLSLDVIPHLLAASRRPE